MVIWWEYITTCIPHGTYDSGTEKSKYNVLNTAKYGYTIWFCTSNAKVMTIYAKTASPLVKIKVELLTNMDKN